MMNRSCVCWVIAALAFVAVPGCNGDDELVIRTVEASEPPVVDPAHHQDKSCVDCHTDWNLVLMHDSKSTLFNSDCISCHGDMSHEKSLDENIKGIHPAMIPWVLPASGQTEVNNQACMFCHESTDLLGGSAAGLRKQVDAQTCQSCHASAGPGRELYK